MGELVYEKAEEVEEKAKDYWIQALKEENEQLRNDRMGEKRFGYGETDLFEWVEDNGKMISTKECVNKLNELYEENKKLKKGLRKCANNWKQEIVERGKLEEEIMKMRDYYESQTSTRED